MPYREITFHGSAMHETFAPGISDIPIPDLPMKPLVEPSPQWHSIAATRPLHMDGPDFSS
jgi:hypothetical protein